MMKRGTLIAFLVCVGVYVFFTLKTLHSGHNWGGDFALYISQADAIVNETTDRLAEKSNYSCEHSYYRMNPDVYPPGYPIMLSTAVAFYGVNLYALKWLNVCCYVLTLLFVFLFVRKHLGDIEGIIVSALLATLLAFIHFGNNLLADIPLMMWVWLAVWLYHSKAQKNSWFYFLLGVICGIAHVTKSLSISLFLAFVVAEVNTYYLLAKGRSVGDFLLHKFMPLFLGFGLLYALVAWLYPYSGGGYGEQLATLSYHSIISNIAYYSAIPKWILYHSNWFVFLTLPAFFGGLIYIYKKHVFDVYFIFIHITLLVIWPFQEGLRFLFFLVPYYFYFSFWGYQWLFKGIQKRYQSSFLIYVKYAVWVIIVGYSLLQLQAYVNVVKHEVSEIDTPEAKGLFEFVKKHTNPDSQFVFFKPNVLRLFAQRESFYLLERRAIEQSPAQWWIYKHGDLPADTAGLLPIYTNKDFTVLKLK